jgi:2,4-dienoyl-CoA reductase (NADPH2)
LTGHKKFEKLLEPYHIGPVKTRNRMIKTGAAMLLWHEDELRMNERVKAFYEAIARGGIGLLIVESPIIDYPLGARWRRRYRIDDDKYIEGLSELTQIIHKHGCPTFMQMNHDGPWQTKHWEITPDIPPLVTDPPIAASPISIDSENDFHNEVPRELTIPEIGQIVDKFASAAVRAQKAGFDGVDINASSSHLLHNFLSPFWNRRQDAYGGSLEKRTRFVVEIIREIKKRLGQDFPVCVNINGVEVGQIVGVTDSECLTPEDSRGIARILQEAGADAIQVRTHWMGYHAAGFLPDALFYPELPIPLQSFPEKYDWRHRGAGAHVLLAAAIKKVLSIPVIAVGRLDPELGEKVLQEGKADFIAMTRRLLADPELPNKVASGKLNDIAPCTACHICLEPRPFKQCRINASIGTDEPYIIKKAKKQKKVLIVGGGPAGMEAARVAALRGHDVTLYEREPKLGGLLPVAAMVKGTEIEDLPALVRYLKRQITKLGVKIRLGKGVNPSVIEQIKPDVVILATGGIPAIPEITGINRHNVISSHYLHRKLKFYLRFLGPRTRRWLTKFFLPIGKRVVIIGGAIHGCELGEFLVKRGREVTIVDTAEALGEGMVYHLKCALFSWFQKRGVTMMTEVRYEEITDEGLTVIDKEGNRQTIKADSIVLAPPLTPDTGLLRSLEGMVPEIYAIGDCREPLLIVDAIADGSRIARAI